MSDYPEHDKLHKIVEDSQTIGAFLDTGLPALDLVLYQRIERDCECHACRICQGELSAWHTEDEKATIYGGRVQITEYVPMRKTIQAILAEHFGIDQEKIDAEKEQMLTKLREANT